MNSEKKPQETGAEQLPETLKNTTETASKAVDTDKKTAQTGVKAAKTDKAAGKTAKTDKKVVKTAEKDTGAAEKDASAAEKDTSAAEKSAEAKESADKKRAPAAENGKKKGTEKERHLRAERRRRLKYGSLSVVVTALFIAGVILCNVLISLVANRGAATIDTTDKKFYELSDNSIQYLKKLDDYKISLTFIGDRQTLMSDSYYIKVLTLAEKYRLYLKNMTISYVDLDKNPGFSANYDNIELTVGDAILACGDRYRHLTSADFINAEEIEGNSGSAQSNSEKKYTYSLTAEYALTTGIMTVTASDRPKATFLTGHGESEVKKLATLLTNNGFTVESQSMLKELDAESNLLVIAAPTKDFSEDELKRLDDFLYNGGQYNKNVMYIADYNQPQLPNLQAFLHDWGFEIGSGVVYESDSKLAYANMPYLNTLTFVDANLTLHAAVAEITAYGYYGRPVKIANVLDINMENKIILQHTDTSKVGTTTADGGFVKGEGAAYPYVAMAYTQLKKIDEEYKVHTSNVLLVNSVEFFDDKLFEKAYSANPDITIAAVDTILGRDNSIYLPAKKLSAAALGITYTQANILGASAAVGIPLILLAICLTVSIRRRFL